MPTPCGQTFAALVTASALIFVIWHTWHYDHWRCLLPTRGDWFRALMCWILITSALCFVCWSYMDLALLYKEYYTVILGETYQTPWQLWPVSEQELLRKSYYILCLGWAFLQSVHLEEFLYWAYMINSIRSPNGPKSTWIYSKYFYSWVAGSLSGLALLFGAIQIETANLNMMKVYLFVTGSCISLCLAFASIGLCLVFPSFIKTTRQLGATQEVLERLYFFSEMNQIRTVFRLLYSLSFLILAVDGLTKAQKVNNSAFWSDFLFLLAELGIFSASCLSVIVLLPRNMSTESHPAKDAIAQQPMVAFRRPVVSGALNVDSARHFRELGNRLNLDRDAIVSGLQHEYEMTTSPGMFPPPMPVIINEPPAPPAEDRPFAGSADRTRRARYSQMPNLPAVVGKFKSPFETGAQRNSGPAKVYVTSHTTITEDS